MIGLTNVGSGSTLNTDSALLCIKAPVYSIVEILKDSITLAVLDTSFGVVDAEDTRLADYYYFINPNNFGEITISIETTKKFFTMGIGQVKSATIEILANKYYTIFI